MVERASPGARPPSRRGASVGVACASVLALAASCARPTGDEGGATSAEPGVVPGVVGHVAAPLAGAGRPLESALWEIVRRPSARSRVAATYDVARERIFFFGGGSSANFFDTCTYDARGFRCVELSEKKAPPRRHSALVAYDELRRHLVLVGGVGDTGDLLDTWIWDGFAWTDRTDATTAPHATRSVVGRMHYDPTLQRVVLWTTEAAWTWDGAVWSRTVGDPPGDRNSSSFLFDPTTSKTFLFGGYDGYTEGRYDETWLLGSGATWSKATPALSPPARNHGAVVFDQARREVLLFGGFPITSDTWAWSDGTWTNKAPPTAPPARFSTQMAYDAARARVLVFGGVGSGSAVLADTWTWDGAAWTARVGAGPTARTSASFVYDPKRERVVFFGGQDTSLAYRDTWEWDGEAWTEDPPPVDPPSRRRALLVFDEAREESVLVAGETAAGVPATGTWVFGERWREALSGGMPARRAAHAAYDASRERVTVFGGEDGAGAPLGDTWTFDGAAWQPGPSGPPARMDGHLVYDPARRQLVLFGGRGEDLAPLGDTWTFDGASWSQVAPLASPPARARAVMLYDEARGRVVLFGGEGAGGTLRGDTWTWDGTSWSSASGAGAPPARASAHAVYDRARGVVVMFGGLSSSDAPLGDTWLWNGATWSTGAGASPEPRSRGSLVYDAHRRRVVLYGGTGLLDERDDTWIWDGAWSRTVANAPPSARRDVASVYDPVRRRVVLAFGFDEGVGVRTGTFTLDLRGGACATNADCAIGPCTDGVCCAQETCGPCQRCDAPEGAGVCRIVANGPDPGSCDGASACDASGRCRRALGESCAAASDCASGSCVDGVCCSGACAGQCEACNEPASRGLCRPVRGRPRGERAACPGVGADAASCDAPACDGVVTEVCSGTIGPCAPYACAESGCKDRCEVDADCDAAASCDLATGRCRPDEAAVCDGDHTLVSSVAPVDCSPYRCEGARCRERCTSVADCAPPFECSRDGACVAPLGEAAPDEGCSCAAAGRAPSDEQARALFAVALAAALVARRRRARRAREDRRRA